MEAVDSGSAPLPGRKGLIRVLLGAGALLWAGLALGPQIKSGAWAAELGPLLHLSAPADAGQAQLEKRAQAAEQQRLSALPVLPGGGAALALLRDAGGRWWRVNKAGVLSPTSSPTARENLSLPELKGVAIVSRERRGGRELLIEAPAMPLRDALPLQNAMASEVRSVDLSEPGDLKLTTHEGTLVHLGAEALAERQDRLAMVLADLAAKKRRAVMVDLRYDGTAVVSLASR